MDLKSIISNEKNPTSEDDIYDFIYIRIKTKVWR